MAKKNKPNELYLTRIYDAPVKAVWDAWVDPERVAQWWGPRGFTLTTKSKDVRRGGHWDYTMHGPDGKDWANKTKYLEVEKYSRLVYDHGGNDDQPALFRVTVEFTEIKGRTKMEMTMALETAEKARETQKFIQAAGGDSTWDRLAEYLEKSSSGKQLFVITRTFGIPMEKMFRMWTDPKEISQWLPPTGSIMEFVRADIRAGHGSFYKMTSGTNVTMYGRIKYLEISEPNRIVYTQQFCDEHEKTCRHPFAPTWPETMLTTVNFYAETPHQTRVTVQWECGDTVTAEELTAFVAAKSGMTLGWTGSFDKLEAHLGSQR